MKYTYDKNNIQVIRFLPGDNKLEFEIVNFNELKTNDVFCSVLNDSQVVIANSEIFIDGTGVTTIECDIMEESIRDYIDYRVEKTKVREL